MIERVARALSLENQSENFMIGEAWEIPGLVNKDGYRKLARAAIEAMREPTEAMIAADQGQADEDAIASWQAMIDAAIE